MTPTRRKARRSLLFKIQNTTLVIMSLSLFVLANAMILGFVSPIVQENQSFYSFVFWNSCIAALFSIAWFSSWLIEDIIEC